MRSQCSGVALVWALFFLLSASVWAGDFRIATRLYVADEKEPQAENVTLFHSGQVYDYQGDGGEVTVFDPPRHRFILLDGQRQVRTEVATESVETFAQKLKTWAAAQSDEFLRFQANPSFEMQLADQPLTFSNQYMTYQVKADKAPDADAARQYSEFSDWYARLNTMSNQTLLPFPRLKVNAELRERQLVPTQVRRTVDGQEARTEHEIVWRLSSADRKRIEQTGEDMATYKLVKLPEYLRKKVPEQAARQ
jgi:hypothetical protein